MRYISAAILTLWSFLAFSQIPDHIYKENIRSVKLFKKSNIYGYPIINLGSTDELQLVFDDMDADYKNYYYTYQLCNADWMPASLSLYNYVKGFQNNRITNYRYSSIAFTRYTNYQASLPDRNCMPSLSGNYLLKVFLNGDTSNLIFTKRFLVVDNKASAGAVVQQPFNANLFNTHQKLVITVNTANTINNFNQQDIKVAVLQNYNWTSAIYLNRPTIYRGNYFEYSDEATTSFASGKEWRWIDLRSLRLKSERMQGMDKSGNQTEVTVKPDGERTKQLYLYYRDINGLYTIENTDNVNPYWQADYAKVKFSYFPPGNRPYPGKNIYLFGELTNYEANDSSKLVFNEERGAYEKTLLLKQGFYNYDYITKPDIESAGNTISYENTEGNYWGTENAYTILVYYRSFGGRSDELISATTINSQFQR